MLTLIPSIFKKKRKENVIDKSLFVTCYEGECDIENINSDKALPVTCHEGECNIEIIQLETSMSEDERFCCVLRPLSMASVRAKWSNSLANALALILLRRQRLGKRKHVWI